MPHPDLQMRKLPLFTFINKMDRPSLEPLELLDTIEQTLKVKPSPVTWPIGSGDRFMGIYDRLDKTVNIFSREKAGAKKATELKIKDLEDPRLAEIIPDDLLSNLKEELEILDEIVEPLDMEEVKTRKPQTSSPAPENLNPETPWARPEADARLQTLDPGS